MRLFRSVLLPLLAAATLPAAPRPKLVVVVSVDQLSAELMQRWGKDLPGGLGRLYREGSTFLEAFQDHGFTETGPGHSVILSGRHPGHTGIVENAWLDRSANKLVYCVEDKSSPLVGARDARGAASFRNLKGDTLGAWLQRQVPGSRVFSVTGKDRSAILMAGRKAQGVYWFSESLGFTTSAAYASTLPSWLKTYNASFLNRTETESFFWSPMDASFLVPGGTYLVHGEPQVMGLPRTILAVGMPRDKAFWDRFRGSPFLDEAIFGAAEALAEGEGLGKGPAVDLLALGLSSTDYVGHGFGNSGPEMMDNLRRLDRSLGLFLERLRAKTPGMWVVLTADHGGGDFPERLQAQGLPAKRIVAREWLQGITKEMSRRLGVPGPFLRLNTSASHMYYLDPQALRSGRSRKEILRAAVEAALAHPDVQDAFTAEDLESLKVDSAQPPSRRSFRERVKLSFDPQRSGDLFVVFKPLCTLDDPTHLCCHGHPHDYDRRVPLVFWGPWRTERRSEPVAIVDLAPTLAHELGISPDEPVDGHVLPLKEAQAH
jgi:predicted AlkP superfamily pyrophosphatase or phosphodiesterase